MTRILLSASHPHGERASAVRPYSHADIDLATSAVVESILERPDVTLRFGAHPSITPLVLAIANSIPGQQGNRVELVYSRYFAAHYTKEMRRLAATEGVTSTETQRDSDPDDAVARSRSLSVMRIELTRPRIDGVFFVGGMSGLDEELVAVSQRHPQARLYAFSAPGGRAEMLGSVAVDAGLEGRFRTIDGRAYLLSSRKVLAEVLPADSGNS